MHNSDNTPNPLVGAWELVSGTYVGADGSVTNYEQASVKSLKILSETKFSFVTQANGSFYAAGGGDYFVDHDIYSEVPSLASEPSMVGHRFAFQYKLEGDTWTNSRWQDGVLVESEVWKRIR